LIKPTKLAGIVGKHVGGVAMSLLPLLPTIAASSR